MVNLRDEAIRFRGRPPCGLKGSDSSPRLPSSVRIFRSVQNWENEWSAWMIQPQQLTRSLQWRWMNLSFESRYLVKLWYTVSTTTDYSILEWFSLHNKVRFRKNIFIDAITEHRCQGTMTMLVTDDCDRMSTTLYQCEIAFSVYHLTGCLLLCQNALHSWAWATSILEIHMRLENRLAVQEEDLTVFMVFA